MSIFFSDASRSPLPEPVNTIASKKVARYLGDSDHEDAFNFDIDEIAPNLPVDAGIAPQNATEDNGEAEIDVNKKKKAPRAKIDEERLLGSKGFPALIAQAMKFKVGEKGKEAEDLKRLMTMYQLWAHQMFPATNFNDTVQRVEVICKKRPMANALHGWRKDRKDGVLLKPKQKTPEPIDDLEDGSNLADPANEAHQTRTLADQTDKSQQRAMIVEDDEFPDEEDVFGDEEAAMAEFDNDRNSPYASTSNLRKEGTQSSLAPLTKTHQNFNESTQTPSHDEYNDADLERMFDLEDEIMKEVEKGQATLDADASVHTSTKVSSSKPDTMADDLDGFEDIDDAALMDMDL